MTRTADRCVVTGGLPVPAADLHAALDALACFRARWLPGVAAAAGKAEIV